MLKVYRVNSKTKEITYEAFQQDYQLWGNRGLTAKVLTEEVNPKCDPLGMENKLVVATGIFAGTTLSTAHRTSFGAKSPLTGGIKESNVGGNLGYFLAQHGIKMFIFEDSPTEDKWHYVKIDKDSNVELLSADEYIGLNTYDFVERMYEIYGKGISVAVIGVAGERSYPIASVMVTDQATEHPCRAAGRGGLGAVMGSKKIKAIVIEKAASKNEIEYADKEKFETVRKNFTDMFLDSPIAPMFLAGTHGLIEATAPMNVLPVRNFSGSSVENEKLEKMNLKALHSKIAQNGGKTGVACQPGCIARCSNIWNNSKGEYVTSGMEYETTALCGPNCDIYDLDYLAEVDRLCDDFGVDSMEIGTALAVCMDAGKIPWGNQDVATGLLKEMVEGTDFGNILGHGTAAVGKALGAQRIPTVKGQGMAAYDPRNLKGIGVTYSISTMGADHTTGNPLGAPGVDPTTKEGKVELAGQLQMGQAATDNIGCMMCVGLAMNPEMMPEMFAGRFGGDWDMDRVAGIGVQTIKMEKEFNQAAGLTAADDKLPDFFSKDPSASGHVYDITTEELIKAFPF